MKEVAIADVLRVLYKLNVIDYVSLDAYIDILQLRLFDRQ